MRSALRDFCAELLLGFVAASWRQHAPRQLPRQLACLYHGDLQRANTSGHLFIDAKEQHHRDRQQGCEAGPANALTDAVPPAFAGWRDNVEAACNGDTQLAKDIMW